MKVEEFVNRLKDSAPLIEDYIRQGFNTSYAIKDRKTFYAEGKKKSTSFQDELLKLVDCYNANDLIIGQIKFYAKTEDKSDYYIVGEVEADWLIVDKITGEIRVVELHSGQSLWSCATNGSNFLEAILMANIFFVKRSSDDDLFNDQKTTCAIADECSKVAGSDDYKDFYKMLLGCFE